MVTAQKVVTIFYIRELLSTTNFKLENLKISIQKKQHCAYLLKKKNALNYELCD